MLLPVHVEPETDEVEDPRNAHPQAVCLPPAQGVCRRARRARRGLGHGLQYKLPEPIPEIKREVVYEVSATLLREHYEAVLKRVKERMNRTEGKMARILDN
jgi:hypothetical protein